MGISTILPVSALVSLLFSSAVANAQQQLGTADEAKAMLEKAVNEIKSNKSAALDKFNKGEGGFKDRDLYVFCFNANSGELTAHPTESLKGTDVRALTDSAGEPIGERIFAAAKAGRIATVEYMFPKPGGNEWVVKQSVVTRIADQGCGVGYIKGGELNKPSQEIRNFFPWPPPTPSTRRAISVDVVLGISPAKTIGDVSSRIENILRESAFDAFGYYRVPGGFALVTRIEGLDGDTGAPLPGVKRWSSQADYSGLDFTSIFNLTRSKGYYRIFVFLLTDDPPMTQPVNDAQAMEYAKRWAMEGHPSLPTQVKSLRLGPRHALILMVYEFERTDGGDVKQLRPNRWPLDEHMRHLSGGPLKAAP